MWLSKMGKLEELHQGDSCDETYQRIDKGDIHKFGPVREKTEDGDQQQSLGTKHIDRQNAVIDCGPQDKADDGDGHG